MIAPLRDILLKLCRREDLTRDEARLAFDHIMSGDATDAQIGGLLVGLARTAPHPARSPTTGERVTSPCTVAEPRDNPIST